jgi:hypothetical protein
MGGARAQDLVVGDEQLARKLAVDVGLHLEAHERLKLLRGQRWGRIYTFAT